MEWSVIGIVLEVCRGQSGDLKVSSALDIQRLESASQRRWYLSWVLKDELRIYPTDEREKYTPGWENSMNKSLKEQNSQASSGSF